MRTLLSFALAVPLIGQTLLNPVQVPWRQVNWDPCVSGIQTTGTRLSLKQIRPLNSDPCWPVGIETAARTVINTRCIRCHGADLIPGDTHLVGNLDLRFYPAMRRGGTRGPALIPGSPENSLIYRFISRPQWPSTAKPDPNENTLGMPPFNQLQPAEIESIRAWIAAGAPTRNLEVEPVRIWIGPAQ